MIILNFMLDHLGIILILAGLFIVALVLWAFWDDKQDCWGKLDTKPRVAKPAHAPAQHAPQFKTLFHAAAVADAETKTVKAPTHHIKPKKH